MTGKFSKKIRFTACLALLSFLSETAVWAQPVSVPVPASQKTFTLPEKITVPVSLGTVEAQKLHPQSGKPFVIYLQDAHAITSAQSSLRKLIAYLQKTYRIPLVALEGGSGALDTTLFKAFPDKHLREKIMQEYFLKGEITGAERAALDERGVHYEGIEDWNLYEENYRAYLEAVGNKPSVLEKISNLQQHLNKERLAVYSKTQNEYHEITKSFHEDPSALSKLLNYFNRNGSFREKANAYPQLHALLQAAGHEHEDANAALRKNSEEFKTRYLPGLKPEARREFERRRQAFLTGETDSVTFLVFWKKFAKEQDLPLELPPVLKSVLRYGRVLSAVKGTRVFEELESCLSEIEKELFISPASQKILRQYRRLEILKRLASLELSRLDLETYEKDKESFSDLLGKDSTALRPAETFYEKALLRDRALHKNLEKLLADHKLPAAIVVAGGFHRQGFEEELEKAGYPYAVMTPRLLSLEGQEHYQDLMSGKVSWAEEVQDSLYEAFSRHAASRLAAGFNALEFTRQMKFWRDEVIRRLAAENRLEEAADYTGFIDEILEKSRPESRGEISGTVEKALKEYQRKVTESVWSGFEKQFRIFSEGIARLKAEKRMTAGNVRQLMPAAQTSLLGANTVKLAPKTRLSPRSIVLAAHRFRGNLKQLRAELRVHSEDDPEHIFHQEVPAVSAVLGGSVLFKAFGDPDAISKDEFLHFIQSEYPDDKPSGILRKIGTSGSVSSRLYNTFLPLLNHFRHYGYDSAEDMWAEFLDVLWEKRQTLIDHLDTSRPVNGYIEVTLRHWLVDQYRRKIKKHRREINESSRSGSGESLDQAVRYEQAREPEAAHDTIVHEQLVKVMSILSPRQRRLLEMHFLEHKSYKEMSEIYGVPVAKVRWRVGDAIHQMRTMLRDQHREEDGEEPELDAGEREQLDAVNAAVNRLEKKDHARQEALHAVMRLYMAGRKYTEIEQAVKLNGQLIPAGTIKRWVATVEGIFRNEDAKATRTGPKLYESLIAIRHRNGGQVKRASHPELPVVAETPDENTDPRNELRSVEDETKTEEEEDEDAQLVLATATLADLRRVRLLWQGENADRFGELRSLIRRYAGVTGMRGTVIRMMKYFVGGQKASFEETAGELFAAARLQEHLSGHYETEVIGLGLYVGTREFDLFLKVRRKKNVPPPKEPLLEDGLYLVEAKEDSGNHLQPLIAMTIEKQVIPQQKYADLLTEAGVPVKGIIVAVGGVGSSLDSSRKPGVLYQDAHSQIPFRRIYSIILKSFDVRQNLAPAASVTASAEGRISEEAGLFSKFSAWGISRLVLRWFSSARPKILPGLVPEDIPDITEEEIQTWFLQRSDILSVFKTVLNPAFQIWPRLHEFKAHEKAEGNEENEELIGKHAARVLIHLQKMEGKRLGMVRRQMRQKELRRAEKMQNLEKRQNEVDGWRDIFEEQNLSDPELKDNPGLLAEVLYWYFHQRHVELWTLRESLQRQYSKLEAAEGPEIIPIAESSGEGPPVPMGQIEIIKENRHKIHADTAWEWLKNGYAEFQAAEEVRAARKAVQTEKREEAQRWQAQRKLEKKEASAEKKRRTPRERRFSIVREFTQSIQGAFEKAALAGPSKVGVPISQMPSALEISRVLLRFLQQNSLTINGKQLAIVHPVYFTPVVYSIATALQTHYYPKGRERAGKNPEVRSEFDWFYAWPLLEQQFGRPEINKESGASRQELREVLLSGVPLDDLDRLYQVFHAISAGQDDTFLRDTFQFQTVNRIFVEDPFGRRIRQWPIEAVFPAQENYGKLLQIDLLAGKHYPKELYDFRENLKKAAADFMEPAGFIFNPGEIHLTISKDMGADGPYFHITFDFPPVNPPLNENDFERIQEPARAAVREAMEFYYPLLWYAGKFNTAEADREAEQEEKIADHYPDQQWEFYYEAAFRRLGETAAWIRASGTGGQGMMIVAARHQLELAAQDLINVQKHLPFGSASMDLRIQQLRLLLSHLPVLMDIFTEKRRSLRHELRSIPLRRDIREYLGVIRMKGAEFAVLKVTNPDTELQRIILNPLGPAEFLAPFGLMVYAKEDKLMGVYITPELRGEGYLRPLLNLFFKIFPDVDQASPSIRNLILLDILRKDYGFAPVRESPAVVHVKRLRGIFLVHVPENDPALKEILFNSGDRTIFQPGYKFVNTRTPHFEPLPIGVAYQLENPIALTLMQRKHPYHWVLLGKYSDSRAEIRPKEKETFLWNGIKVQRTVKGINEWAEGAWEGNLYAAAYATYTGQFLKNKTTLRKIVEALGVKQKITRLSLTLDSGSFSGNTRQVRRLKVRAYGPRGGKIGQKEFAVKFFTPLDPNSFMELKDLENEYRISERYKNHPVFRRHFARTYFYRQYRMSRKIAADIGGIVNASSVLRDLRNRVPPGVVIQLDDWIEGKTLHDTIEEQGANGATESLVTESLTAALLGWYELDGLLFDAAFEDIIIARKNSQPVFIDSGGAQKVGSIYDALQRLAIAEGNFDDGEMKEIFLQAAAKLPEKYRSKAIRDIRFLYFSLENEGEFSAAQADNLRGVLSQYDLGDEVHVHSIPNKDKENIFYVSSSRGKFVLKAPRFRNKAALLRWEAEVLEKLKTLGVAGILKNFEGKPFVREGGKLYVLYEAVEGKEFNWGEVNGAELEAAAVWLAKMHERLKNFTPAARNYTVENRPQVISVLNHETGLKRIEELYKTLSQRGPPKYSGPEQLFLNSYPLILRSVYKIRARFTKPVLARLPVTVVHGDYHQGNFRYQKDGNLRVFDFEYSARDARLFDLANPLLIRYQPDGSSLDFKKVETFLLAYDRQNRLTKEEIDLLPEIFRLEMLEGVLIFAGMHGGKEASLAPLAEQILNFEKINSFDWSGLRKRILAARQELRTAESAFELPDDKLRSEIEKTYVSFEQLREKELIVRVPVFLFQEETETEDLNNFDVDTWEEMIDQKKIGQKWDEYVVRLDAEGNPQVLYRPANSLYGPVLWTYPETDEGIEDSGLNIPSGDRSWERVAAIKRWQGLLERLPQKKLDEEFRESLRQHFESIIADLQGRVIFSIQKESDAGIWIQRQAYPDQIDPYELQWRRRPEKDDKSTGVRHELRQVLFSNVSLEDLKGLQKIYTAMRRKSETAFLDDVMVPAMPDRIFVTDAFGLRFDEWQLKDIFPNLEDYAGLPNPVTDFQIRLKTAAFNFMELIGMLHPGAKLTSEAFESVQVTVAEEIQADGKPVFFITLHLSSAPLNLSEKDIEDVPEKDKKDFKEAFDFFYPVFQRGGNISTSLAMHEAKELDRIAGKNPNENWMFYYDAALKWIGLAANWLQEPISGELWAYTIQLQRYLTFANQSVQKVQQYSPQGPEVFEPLIKKIKVLKENSGRAAAIFKERQQRHEIRSGISKEAKDKPKSILELTLPPAEVIAGGVRPELLERQAMMRISRELSSRFSRFEGAIEGIEDPLVFGKNELTVLGESIFDDWAPFVDTTKLADVIIAAAEQVSSPGLAGKIEMDSETLRRVRVVLDHADYFAAQGKPLFTEHANAVMESGLLFELSGPENDENVRRELMETFRWSGILYPVGKDEPRLRELVSGAGDRFSLFAYKEGEAGGKKVSQRELERGRETPATISFKGTPVVFSADKLKREKFKNLGIALDPETVRRLRSLGFNFRQILTLMKIYTSPGLLRRQLEERPDAFPELTPGALKTGLEALASLWTQEMENFQRVQAAA